MSARLTLALDASTYVGTVAVWRGEQLVAEGEALMRGQDVERLMPAVIDTLAEGGAALRELSRVVCGAGPGSFTSLRIAAAIAKGIVTGTQGRATLHEVSSLALIVGARAERLAPGRYLAMLDAMRGERYARVVIVEPDHRVRVAEELPLVPSDQVAEACRRYDAIAIGPDEMLEGRPHARGALAVAGGRWEPLPTLALGQWEPRYGRLAEAQVKWEAAHGRPFPATGA